MFIIFQKLEEEVETSKDYVKSVQEELDTIKKEQDDLLVLLADQDAKIERYRHKLKQLGQEVSLTLRLVD